MNHQWSQHFLPSGGSSSDEAMDSRWLGRPRWSMAMSNRKHRDSWILIGFIYDGFWYILEEDPMMYVWKLNDSWFEGMIYSSILKEHEQAHVFLILYSEVDPCISICAVFALHGGVKFLLYPICCQDLLEIQIMLVPHDGLFILKSNPSNPCVVQDDSGTEKSSQTIWQGSIEGPPRKTRRGRNPLGFPEVLWYLYFGHPMIWMLQFQTWQYDDACASLLRIASVFKDSSIYFLHFYWWSIIICNFGVMFFGWFWGSKCQQKSHERKIRAGTRSMQVFEVSSTFCTFLCSGIRRGIRVDWKSEKKSTQRGFLIHLNIWLYIQYIYNISIIYL